jgi:5-methylcytosine-specific restriction endonuclease McrA
MAVRHETSPADPGAGTDEIRNAPQPNLDLPAGICRGCERPCDPNRHWHQDHWTEWEETNRAKPGRLKVFERDGFCCRICGAGPFLPAELHDDHITPLAEAGWSEWNSLDNRQTLCPSCHEEKTRTENVTRNATATAAASRPAAPPTTTGATAVNPELRDRSTDPEASAGRSCGSLCSRPGSRSWSDRERSHRDRAAIWSGARSRTAPGSRSRGHRSPPSCPPDRSRGCGRGGALHRPAPVPRVALHLPTLGRRPVPPDRRRHQGPQHGVADRHVLPVGPLVGKVAGVHLRKGRHAVDVTVKIGPYFKLSDPDAWRSSWTRSPPTPGSPTSPRRVDRVPGTAGAPAGEAQGEAAPHTPTDDGGRARPAAPPRPGPAAPRRPAPGSRRPSARSSATPRVEPPTMRGDTIEPS